MKGITEERLREIIEDWSPNDRIKVYAKIIPQCTELNPWLPIADAPLGKKLRLFTKVGYQVDSTLSCELEKMYYTRFCELPEDPKE